MKAIYILRSMDNPPRILIFNASEAFIIIVPMLLAPIFDSILLFPFGIIIWCFWYSFKKKFKHQNIRQYMYWHFPSKQLKKSRFIKNIPESHLREFSL